MPDLLDWQTWQNNPTLKNLAKGLMILGWGIVIGLFTHAYFYSPINTDAGFYLSMADQWFNGAVIYRDIWMNYTPLGIYLFGLCDIWTDTPDYGDYLFVLYLFNFLNAGWVYLLSRKLELSPFVSAGAALVSLGLFYKYEAILIVLEPFMLFFLLPAVYLALFATRSDRYWLLVGVLTSLAFLCKQYSLAVIPAMLYWMYKLGGFRYIWRLGLFFIAGFCIPILIFLIHYYVKYEMAPNEILQIWFSSGGYGERNLGQMFVSLLLFVGISIPMLLAFPLTLSKQKLSIGLKVGGEKIFLLLLSASMTLPLFFQQYGHYLLLIIPFGVLLCAYMLKYHGKHQRWIRIALIVNLLLFGGRMVRAVYHTFSQPLNQRTEQYTQTQALMEEVPEGSEVLLLSYYHQRLNYLCKYKPVLREKYGYGFPMNLNDTQLKEVFENTQTVITEYFDLAEYPRYQRMLVEYNFKQESTVEGLEIWRKE